MDHKNLWVEERTTDLQKMLSDSDMTAQTANFMLKIKLLRQFGNVQNQTVKQ
ncbi:hypothetical protein GX48_08364 [Paracoccidioides brasiliensis]|nr:hypothetical protein GX48_08364 [Paracoccidioides brasiliensis]